MDLQADSIQGVLFLAPNQQQADAPKIWESLFGSHAAELTQRVPNTPFLQSVAAGGMGDHYINIASQVGNISVTLSKRVSASNQEPQQPQRIDNIAEAVELLAGWMASVAESLQLLRLGIVLDLSRNVESGEENEQVRKLLPGFSFPTEAIDIMAQMNFQTHFPSYVSMKMNRFCQWQSGQIAIYQFQLPQFPGMLVGQNPSAARPFVGLKIDVNSVPGIIIPNEVKGGLISDLAAEANAIQQEGFARFSK